MTARIRLPSLEPLSLNEQADTKPKEQLTAVSLAERLGWSMP